MKTVSWKIPHPMKVHTGVDQRVQLTWDDHWGKPLLKRLDVSHEMGQVNHAHLGAKNSDQPACVGLGL